MPPTQGDFLASMLSKSVKMPSSDIEMSLIGSILSNVLWSSILLLEFLNTERKKRVKGFCYCMLISYNFVIYTWSK